MADHSPDAARPRVGLSSPADTIAAVASAPGRGGVGMVRVSGPLAAHIAEGIAGPLPPARQAVLRALRDGDGAVLDRGLVLFFPGPHSFTGEDVLELHGHGAPVVLEALVQRACALGARRAGPGEFTRRAYLNGKLDLAQAEAVADLINSASVAAARAAARSLEGEFSDRVQGLCAALTELRVEVEAGLDFPDEDLPLLPDVALVRRLAALREQLAVLRQSAGQGRVLRDGVQLVLVGAPNVGKSSLLNRLVGYPAAIVTPVPGTTRDVLREALVLDGLPVHLADTAGLRDAMDEIEQEGVRRALEAGARADHVLFVTTAQAPEPMPAPWLERADAVFTRVINKTDLPHAAGPPWPGARAGCVDVPVSAHTGAGLPELIVRITSAAGLQPGSTVYGARLRHVQALDSAAQVLSETDPGTPELLAEALRRAARALAEITGAQDPEALLDAIFSRFCIGK